LDGDLIVGDLGETLPFFGEVWADFVFGEDTVIGAGLTRLVGDLRDNCETTD